jgi:hypothetical protein
MKGWKKINRDNIPPKQAGIAIFVSDIVDIKPILIKQDKEEHSILIKREIDQRKQQLSTYMHLVSTYPISSNIP